LFGVLCSSLARRDEIEPLAKGFAAAPTSKATDPQLKIDTTTIARAMEDPTDLASSMTVPTPTTATRAFCPAAVSQIEDDFLIANLTAQEAATKAL